jgi:Uma2 family endonuclease
MSSAARKKATYQDVLDAPSNMVAQVLGGVLHTHPRPATTHARTASALGHFLGGPFDHDPSGPGGWWILDEPELHLGEDILVPDLAGWRRDRLAAIPSAPFITQAPDWICEVLSPSTERIDRKEKLAISIAKRSSRSTRAKG